MGFGAVFSVLLLPAFAASPTSGSLLSKAAEYHYQHHSFAHSLELWEKSLAREPDNVLAAVRVGELAFWVSGRAAMMAHFKNVLAAVPPLSQESRNVLKKHFWGLQNLFAQDKSQQAFLQGRHRAEIGDWKGAWEQFNRAASLDPAQFSVLFERARAEKQLSLFERHRQTLVAAVDSYPYHSELIAELAEAHLNARAPAIALEVLNKVEGPPTPQQRVLTAMALLETGAPGPALGMLRSLLQQPGVHFPPIVFYGVGKALMQTERDAGEVARWYRKFLSHRPESAPVAGWDPFRYEERVSEVGAYLADKI